MNRTLFLLCATWWAGCVLAGVGDPQTKTDHPWYPGELSCSTFERLFKTQNDLYTRVTGRKTDNDEDKALAAWYWRNLNYTHCIMAGEDIDGGGWQGNGDKLVRDFWSGLFSCGFGLCFDTHHQFSGEIWHLFGPNRCRTTCVSGHTSFEVYLKGGAYGSGAWALLDHDISTVVFKPDGSRLVGLMDILADQSLVQKGNRGRGWLPGGLYPDDPKAYCQVKNVGYQTGYAAVPPIVNLRAGETLRRYPFPGLEDGKTFAYWGINFNTKGVPGPERPRTWVNQPEKMFGAKREAPCIAGMARYGNAVYTYKPDFSGAGYKEAVVSEDDKQVTLEWYSPYVIAAMPPAESATEKWGVFKENCAGGLVIRGQLECLVEISTDQGANWKPAPAAVNGAMDLTDLAKGHRQYWLRFSAKARTLAKSGLSIVTVCQCAQSVVPHVKDGVNHVAYEASNQGFVSAGPNKDQTKPHIIAGEMNSPAVTLQLEAPRHARVTGVYASAHAACSAPPKPADYNIDYSIDTGATWQPLLHNYQVKQIPPEPKDWWSQAFMMGETNLNPVASPVQIRYSNTGNRTFMRVEAQLVYDVTNSSPLQVTYAWKESGAVKTASHVYPANTKQDSGWSFSAGTAPETFYVEYAAQ